MNKITLLFFLCLMTSVVFCQTNLTELFRVEGLWTKKGENNPYTGEFKETYKDGSLKGTGAFVSGKLEGVRVQYFLNGKKRTEKEYINAYKQGKSKEFYKDGTLKMEGSFVDHKETGTWGLFYQNGNKKAILTFASGMQNGPYFEYNEQGVLVKQYYFKNGKPEYSDEFIKLSSMALELSRQFKYEEAIQLYNKVIELNPTVAQVYFNRGACRGNSFDFEGSIKDYDKAIEIDPQYMEAYGNRGNAKINMYTTMGTLNPSAEQTVSSCEDFHKAKELGDTSIGTVDMIYIHCR